MCGSYGTGRRSVGKKTESKKPKMQTCTVTAIAVQQGKHGKQKEQPLSCSVL